MLLSLEIWQKIIPHVHYIKNNIRKWNQSVKDELERG